jgi:hypothetical protein
MELTAVDTIQGLPRLEQSSLQATIKHHDSSKNVDGGSFLPSLRAGIHGFGDRRDRRSDLDQAHRLPLLPAVRKRPWTT